MLAIKFGKTDNVKLLTEGQDVNGANQVTPVRCIPLCNFCPVPRRVWTMTLLWTLGGYSARVPVSVDRHSLTYMLEVLLCKGVIINVSAALNRRYVFTKDSNLRL